MKNNAKCPLFFTENKEFTYNIIRCYDDDLDYDLCNDTAGNEDYCRKTHNYNKKNPKPGHVKSSLP